MKNFDGLQKLNSNDNSLYMLDFINYNANKYTFVGNNYVINDHKQLRPINLQHLNNEL